jgi:hypothetical protein
MSRLLAITLGVALALVGTTALAARNSSGTYSLEPAAPFVTNTPISSSTMNTRFSSIATALTDSLSRGGSGPMLSALSLYSGGSATVPELSWADDSNSGLYLISNDNLGLSIGGTKRWDFGTAGTSLTGTFDVSGATSLASTLTTRGAAVFSSTVAVTGATALTGALTGGAATFDSVTAGTLTVAHAATFTDPVTVGTPTAAMHAATKAYVDAAFTTCAITAGANWTANRAHAYRIGNVVVVTLNITAGAGAVWSDIGTIAAACRPTTGLGRYLVGQAIDQSLGAAGTFVGIVSFGANGVIQATNYDNGTSLANPMFAIAAGDIFDLNSAYAIE